MSDWDAGRYHCLSDPQLEWGRAVLARLAPVPGERILDLGCGTGRLTAELMAALGQGAVIGCDASHAMLSEAVRGNWRPSAVHFVRADGTRLPFVEAFDAVFSTATFHWIADHDALFASINQALVPGGRLVAQCGGGPNLQILLNRAHRLMESARFKLYFGDWSDPWHFADVPATIERLHRAGFTSVHASLEPAPTTLPDARAYSEFLACVCVRHHVARLPDREQPRFIGALAEEASADTPPFTLDYWRLNLAGRRPVGAERAA